MEMFNPKGKSLSELIKETESKGIQVVLLGEDAENGKHMALIEILKHKDSVLLVSIADLPSEDQKKIQHDLAVQRMELLKINKPFEPEPFVLKAHPDILPEFIQDETKSWQSQRKRTKLKGWQKK